MGWLAGWSYRKSHIINSTDGAGTNYQVKIKVHYDSGTDSGENVYLNEKCKTDFGDIRFTKSDGETELDYWMEEKEDSNYAIFWVEIVDDLSSSNVTIYIYYGKSDASTTSNGDDTFLFFDDFEGTELDTNKWTKSGSGSVTVSGGICKVIGGGGTAEEIESITFGESGQGLRWRSRHKYSHFETQCYEHAKLQIDSNNYPAQISSYSGDKRFYSRASGTTSYTTYSSNPLVYHDWEIRWISGKSVLDVDDGAETVTKTNNIPNPNTAYLRYITDKDSSDYIIYIDWVFIAKYVDPEPSHGDWGTEEAASWLYGWQHRKSHVINSASGAGTNYQIKIIAHYGSGEDYNDNTKSPPEGHVYLNGHCKTDFGDVRFTGKDSSGNGQEINLLDYWIEEKVDSDYAIFWVELQYSLDSENQTIYIYYGKDDSTTISNGDETFLIWDDFSDLSRWTETDPNNHISMDTANKKIDIEGLGRNEDAYFYRSLSIGNSDGIRLFCQGKLASTSDDNAIFVIASFGGNIDDFHGQASALGVRIYRYDPGNVRLVAETDSASQVVSSLSENTMYYCVLTRTPSGSIVLKVYSDAGRTNLIGSTTAFTEQDTFSYFFVAQSWNSGSNYYAYGEIPACVFVTKYVDPEPTHGSWGSEESSGASQNCFETLKLEDIITKRPFSSLYQLLNLEEIPAKQESKTLFGTITFLTSVEKTWGILRQNFETLILTPFVKKAPSKILCEFSVLVDSLFRQISAFKVEALTLLEEVGKRQFYTWKESLSFLALILKETSVKRDETLELGLDKFSRVHKFLIQKISFLGLLRKSRPLELEELLKTSDLILKRVVRELGEIIHLIVKRNLKTRKLLEKPLNLKLSLLLSSSLKFDQILKLVESSSSSFKKLLSEKIVTKSSLGRKVKLVLSTILNLFDKATRKIVTLKLNLQEDILLLSLLFRETTHKIFEKIHLVDSVSESKGEMALIGEFIARILFGMNYVRTLKRKFSAQIKEQEKGVKTK